MAIALSSEFDIDVDLNKVLKMLVIHEIGEVLIGDITPFDNITPQEKEELEHQAIISIIGDLATKDELIALMLEFDEHQTKESIFAYHCDKLEADIQSKVYQDMGYHHSLDEQENNVVFKSSKVQRMLDEGAETAFDIWYEYDKGIYTGDEPFVKALRYIKDNNTKI